MFVRTHFKAVLGAVAGAGILIVAGCSESPKRSSGSPVAPSGATSVTRLAEGNFFELCKDYQGVIGPAVTFNVSVDQDNNGSIDTTFQVQLSNGQCRDIWSDVGIGRDIVTVTEVVPTGYTPSFVRSVLQQGTTTTDASVNGATASGPVAHADVGTLVIFTNSANPEELGDGRFTGGGQVLVAGVRISKGLTIHCDLILSNNLEVNWNGNKFHMTEHNTTIECSDDPAIIQAPPPAPLDTMRGRGTGTYNGTSGYIVEFTFVDYGEPGSDDKVALKIYAPGQANNPVLSFPLTTVDNGNLQAHFDQPHK
jgi:hypothetical protein